MTAPANLQAEWATLLIDSLVDAGIDQVVLSPGSRSAPFVLAVAAAAARGALRAHTVIDERAAGFHALGIARGSGRPALLLCTSGSAGAHYLPALVEAAHAFVPLVVLTADRPFELQGCAAPQTIDQVKLFGDHARAYFECGLPDESEGALRALRRLAAQAVATSLAPTPGAVHVNARARKPLEPPAASDLGAAERSLQLRVRAIAAPPIVRAFAPRLVPDERGLTVLADACRRARRGVLIAGPAPLRQAEARREAFALARALGYPLLADAASQLRFVPGREVVACDAHDAVLAAPSFRAGAVPDLAIQIGAPPTSPAVDAWLAEHPECERWVIAPSGWQDPSARATAHLGAEIAAAAAALTARVGGVPADEGWLARFTGAEALARAAIEDAIGAEPAGEPALVLAAVRAIPRGESVLCVGNSLPIREVDAVCQGGDADCLVAAQRGANGIDGMCAGAAGVARAGRPVTLLVGDVSALHDLGGLATAVDLPTSLAIVVLNNGGGRIFEQLPLAERSDLRADLARFTTPHGLVLGPAARLFGHRYEHVAGAGELAAAIAVAHRSPGCTLIEAAVDPASALRFRDRLRHRIAAVLAASPWGAPA